MLGLLLYAGGRVMIWRKEPGRVVPIVHFLWPFFLCLFLRTEHSFWKTPSNLGARGTLPFGSKSRQRTGTKKQISLAEWKQVEKMKILKQIAEEKDVTKNPIHRVSSPAFEKPGKIGYIFKQPQELQTTCMYTLPPPSGSVDYHWVPNVFKLYHVNVTSFG